MSMFCLQGQLKSTLMCLHCQKMSVNFQAFMFLTLPIPPSSRCSLGVRVFLLIAYCFSVYVDFRFQIAYIPFSEQLTKLYTKKSGIQNFLLRITATAETCLSFELN